MPNPRLAPIAVLAWALLVDGPQARAADFVDDWITFSTPTHYGAYFHMRSVAVPQAYEENGKLPFTRTQILGARLTEYWQGPVGTCSSIAWNTLCPYDASRGGGIQSWGDLQPFSQTSVTYGRSDTGTFSARLESVFFGTAKLKEVRAAREGFGLAFGTTVGIDPTVKGGPISIIWEVFLRIAPSAFPFVALRLDMPMAWLVLLPLWLPALPYLLGIPRLGVELMLPLGPVFVGGRASVPTRFVVVPWFFDGADLTFEAGLQF